MTRPAGARVWRAGPDDAAALGRLLHDFNREFDEPSPGPGPLTSRMRELLADGATAALLAGDGPDGIAVLRFRKAIWSAALECYLAELYVAPGRRGAGLGRALMAAAFALARERGADRIELGTSTADVAARALYEKLGFTCRERDPDGPVMLVYERAL